MKTYVVGASNEYPLHMFSWRSKNKYYVDTLISEAMVSEMDPSVFELGHISCQK